MSELERGRVENGAEVGHMDERSVDETLRMIARMPAPVGLEERVKAKLALAEMPGRVLAWPRVGGAERVGPSSVWVRSGWARGAAAAAISLVVVGGGWGIYARVGPTQSAKGGALPHAQPSGTFSEAGAMRRPQTLTGPVVAGSEHKGPDVLKPVGQPTLQSKKTGTTQGAEASGAAKLQKNGSAERATAPAQ